jgi:hypothetical protein
MPEPFTIAIGIMALTGAIGIYANKLKSNKAQAYHQNGILDNSNMTGNPRYHEAKESGLAKHYPIDPIPEAEMIGTAEIDISL